MLMRFAGNTHRPAAQGLMPATSTPAALGDIVVRDRTRWADVVAKRGIQPE